MEWDCCVNFCSIYPGGAKQDRWVEERRKSSRQREYKKSGTGNVVKWSHCVNFGSIYPGFPVKTKERPRGLKEMG